MRYDLAYYKNVPQRDEDTIIRLEIYKKMQDGSALRPSREIGDVLTALNLNIEGQGEDIDAPIVKTSLTFSVIDAPERNTREQKCGDWEEFYTADETGWKVCLLGKSRQDSEFTMMWGGYVTPDSYTETLQYHGVVTITARDNIGHLQDYDFDAVGNGAGMITPYELINQAWEKIESPMRLDWRGEDDENEWPQAAGIDAEQTFINVAAYEGKSWYDAVSETLYAYGMVMRYNGCNCVSVCPLRRLPLQGRAGYDYMPHVTPVFEAYATRELMPAVKSIEESVSYDHNEGKEAGVIPQDQFGSYQTYTTKQPDNAGNMIAKTITVHAIANESQLATGWGSEANKSLFFNHYNYRNSTGEKLAEQVCFAMGVDTAPTRLVWYSQPIKGEALKIKIERGTLFQMKSQVLRAINNYYLDVDSVIGVLNFTTADNVDYYYDGKEWHTSSKGLTLKFEDGVVELDVLFPDDMQVYGTLTLFITSVRPLWKLGGDFTSGGPYVGLKLSFTKSGEQSLAERNTVRTIYDESNNVKLSRTPAVGPALNEVTFPVFIKNGIFRKDGDNYVPTPEWKWYREEDADAVQLPVVVHKQLLAYYSKPNNLISGTIMNPHLLDPRVIWVWKGREHYMLGGSFDFLNGVIEGATLREFLRYNQLWPLYRYLITEDGQRVITESGDYIQVGI